MFTPSRYLQALVTTFCNGSHSRGTFTSLFLNESCSLTLKISLTEVHKKWFSQRHYWDYHTHRRSYEEAVHSFKLNTTALVFYIMVMWSVWEFILWEELTWMPTHSHPIEQEDSICAEIVPVAELEKPLCHVPYFFVIMRILYISACYPYWHKYTLVSALCP